jgi:hypothetical protein
MPGAGLRAPASVSGNIRALAATAAALALLAACGEGPEPVPEARPYLDPGFVEAGNHRLHYALTPARDLPAAIAGSYGIEQRKDLAVLTIAIAPRDPRAAGGSEAPQVEADAVALTGVREPLALRAEPGGASWIATVAVRHRVPVTIEIRARATADGPPLVARLTREFRLE